MIKIGITGGIGAGKSFVARRFSEYGVPVYNCDDEAKRLMTCEPAIVNGLKNLVSPDVYGQDGTLNKPLLADYVFSDSRNRAKVNAVVHPAVFRDFGEWAVRQGKSVVAVESAILFESGLADLVDVSVCVTAPLGLRIERVVERDGTDRAKVEARISSQMADEERMAKSDFIVTNDGTESVDDQVKKILDRVVK